VTGGVNEFALYEPGKVVVYITDNLNFELHEKSNYKRTTYGARVVANGDTEIKMMTSPLFTLGTTLPIKFEQ
jgi:hypothetical protein